MGWIMKAYDRICEYRLSRATERALKRKIEFKMPLTQVQIMQKQKNLESLWVANIYGREQEIVNLMKEATFTGKNYSEKVFETLQDMMPISIILGKGVKSTKVQYYRSKINLDHWNKGYDGMSIEVMHPDHTYSYVFAIHSSRVKEVFLRKDEDINKRDVQIVFYTGERKSVRDTQGSMTDPGQMWRYLYVAPYDPSKNRHGNLELYHDNEEAYDFGQRDAQGFIQASDFELLTGPQGDLAQ